MTVSLRELQENFQAYILAQDKPILDVICTDEANAIERINVYRVGYSLRLLEVLEKDFPFLKKFVGHDLFEKMGANTSMPILPIIFQYVLLAVILVAFY